MADPVMHTTSDWEVEPSLYEGFGASIYSPSRPRGKQTIAEVREYRDAKVMAAGPKLLEALKGLLPTNISLSNPNLPDSMVLPCDVTLGELRRAAAAIASATGATP